jgi:hypothetical protein
MLIGFSPGFLAYVQGCAVDQALGQDQALKRREPMVIVLRTVVGLAAVGRCLEFIGKRGGPFIPSEMPLLGKLDRERKGLRLPGFGEHWPAVVGLGCVTQPGSRPACAGRPAESRGCKSLTVKA